MSTRMLRAPLIVVIALLVGGASAFGMPYVPHTAPSVTITSKPTAWSNVAGPTFKWSKSGTISSTTCQIDGGSFTACTTSKTYSGLAAGSHTFAVKVSGSGGSTTKTYTWQIDLTDPTDPTAVTGGSLSWRNTTASLVPSGSTDGESGLKGYQYRKSTDGGSTWGTVTSGNSASVSGAGTTITQFRAIDLAANTSAWFPTVADATNTVKIDKTAADRPDGDRRRHRHRVAERRLGDGRRRGLDRRRRLRLRQVSGAVVEQRRPHLRRRLGRLHMARQQRGQ